METPDLYSIWMLWCGQIKFLFYTTFRSQGVTNFVLYKFGHLAQKEWQTMYDLAKMFLHCLNHWKLETPAIQKQHSDDVTIFKVNYTRSASLEIVFMSS